MDKARRVVLPKQVRNRFELREGSDLETIEAPEGILLKPTEREPPMINKGGLWVHTAKLPPRLDIAQAIWDDREDRIRKVAGL